MELKYLTSEFWRAFNSKIPSKRGKKFEKLIESVLYAMYGQSKWIGTKDSWDGSKDFYYYNIDSNMWAECKNYSSSIGLKVVSPSLVMARIYDIDTLLFFSYSPINDNTKSKIAKYADKTFLQVKFYDDEALEKLLFNCWNNIGTKYFKKYNNSVQTYSSEPVIDIKIYKNPLLNQKECSNNIIGEINTYHIFEIDICIINRNDVDLQIEIKFDDLQLERLQYFDVNPYKLRQTFDNIIIPAYESFVYKIFMSPIVGGLELSFPKILVNSKSKEISLNKDFLVKPIKCKFSKENRLVGEKYNNIVNNFNDNIIHNNIVFALYGGSGVGKSRLFTECIKKCALKDYIILNFSAGYHTTSELRDAENLVKGIIIALYELSDDEILNLFYKIAVNPSASLDNNTFSAFQMIKDFLSAQTSSQYITLIDKYIDILCNKLKQRKYLIAVDNVQFFDESIAYFFHKILSILINSRDGKKSLFLLTFNTDYMRTDSLCMELLLFLKERHPLLERERIIGFQSDDECEVYLQESLCIGDSMEKDDIEKIIKKTNRNPFYLEQMVLWLYENGILEIRNGNYIVKKPEELLVKMNEVPKEVNEIIKQRWIYYLATHAENETIQILSAIHFYSFLSKQCADSLQINWNMVEEMEKSGFISILSNDSDSVATFYHDIIENFFTNQYFPLCKFICDHESKNKLDHKKLKYQHSLFTLCVGKKIDIDILRENLSLKIPEKLAGEFYFFLYKCYINYFSGFHDENQWITDVTRLIAKIRDHLGNDMMLSVAVEIESVLNKENYLTTETCYGRYLLTISETLDSIGNYKEAHDLVLDYKNQLELKDTSIEQKKFLSELYNRLHVYRRHQCESPLTDSLTMEYIEKAIQISKETEFYEMEYVNNSDMGYLYYSLPAMGENKQFTLQYWEMACEVFICHEMPSKTLNYIRKCVQIALLQKLSDKAISKCKEGIDYIEYGEHSYQKLFFRWWFHLALAEGYLQDISSYSLEDVNKCLNKAQEYADLLKTNKKYYVLFLRAIYFYYKGSYEKSIEYFTNCYELLSHSNYISKMKILLGQIESNKKIVMQQFIADNKKHLVSQITTKDGLFNLICL